MIDIVTMAVVLFVGLLMGGFFFGSLFWTVEWCLFAEHPTFWFLGSYLMRFAVILGGFYLISAGQWGRLTVCAAGFFIARFLLIQYARTLEKTRVSGKEAGNAS